MGYHLAVFRSRSQAYSFKSILDSYKVQCSIVPTPRNISVSCGLSVKFAVNDLPAVKEVFKRRKFDTFVGFF
jgi:hypothetical protein